ncbi:MAG: phosphoribosylanthranilate isomerase [Anaerofustis sp.]
MTKIKICGLRRSEDIAAVNEAMPDYIGFVFAESRRRITKETARELKHLLDPNILSVGVFVNATLHEIMDICSDGIIDLIQLHGDESEKYTETLRSECGLPIIKAVRVASRQDILSAEHFPCDYLLLDTYQKDAYGGSGITFDWGLIPSIEKPYFLAGGLNEENIAAAIKTCRPYCVDVSSGAETDGYKDREKIKRIVQTVRSII